MSGDFFKDSGKMGFRFGAQSEIGLSDLRFLEYGMGNKIRILETWDKNRWDSL